MFPADRKAGYQQNEDLWNFIKIKKTKGNDYGYRTR